MPRREAELLSCSRSGSGVSLPLPPYEQRSGAGGGKQALSGETNLARLLRPEPGEADFFLAAEDFLRSPLERGAFFTAAT